MPLYEFRCVDCRHVQEALVGRHGEAAPPCPRCGGSRSERLPSVFAVAQPRAGDPPGPCGSSDCACRQSR